MSDDGKNIIERLIEARKEKEIILSKLEVCKKAIRETEGVYLAEIGKKVVGEKLLQEMYWTLRVTYDDRVVLVGDSEEGKVLKELMKLVEPITIWMVGHVPLVRISNISLGMIIVKDMPVQISIQIPLDDDEAIDMVVAFDMFKKAHIDFDRIDLEGLDKEIEWAESKVSVLENWRKMLSN